MYAADSKRGSGEGPIYKRSAAGVSRGWAAWEAAIRDRIGTAIMANGP